ncbi:MAG: hypothetical protein A3D31_10360 [Candidatus Fluviicola riflensis]|nr:MAG: hypothetical protein CHH17_14780 [Candidatus Fluviicola riflensis]OGS77405.1 MAG: hypothetical protein A3D31_10360 [Candidatus Fluviicola riflensis]OGS83985.1 MAG: hypothetical protein A3E30_11760 [Fluviicola sp. RIFCSPHIGHO2_12_FULL_43_24]OGS84472.1 MAG: hypothetical protein A2724_07300 [Fluviicola sp. RIFCSPHIGHO2_01_FULL_43_53]
MKLSKLFGLALTCFVIGFVSFMSLLGIAMIQHYLHIGIHPPPEWNEHGYPFTFYYETTFNDDGLEGGNIKNFLVDFLIYFLFFSLIFIGYKWIKNRTKKGSR